MPNPLLGPLMRYLGGLSHPRLFMIMAVLFGLNMIIPDPIPFVDELLMGLATLALGNWKRRGADVPPPR